MIQVIALLFLPSFIAGMMLYLFMVIGDFVASVGDTTK